MKHVVLLLLVSVLGGCVVLPPGRMYGPAPYYHHYDGDRRWGDHDRGQRRW